MDIKMLCPNCGKELPEESRFCPYCMTKFGAETRFDNSSLTPKRSKRKLIIILSVIAAALVAAVAVFVAVMFANNAGNDVNGVNSSEESEVHSTQSEDKSASADPIKDNAVGCAADYGSNFFLSVTHTQLMTNESFYRSAKIRFDCVVLKVEGKTVFVEYGASRGFDGIYSSTGDYAALIFAEPVSDIAYGDSLTVYGRFDGTGSYNVGGEKYEMPDVTVQSVTDFVYYSVLTPVLTEAEVEHFAKEIFGKETAVRESVKTDFADSSFADILIDGGLFYTADTGKAKYCIYAGEGSFVFDCASAYPMQKYVIPIVSQDYIYFCMLSEADRTYTLECCDRDLNRVWSRTFENAYSAVNDCTEKYIYLVADSNLYIIDAKTGEDAVSHRYVGSKCEVVKLEDGLLLISPTGKDNVMKTDLAGNIIYTSDLPYDIPATDSDAPPCVQVINSGFIISYEALQDGQAAGTYTAVVSHEGKIIFENLER